MYRLVVKARNREDAKRFTEDRLGESAVKDAQPVNGYDVTRQYVVTVDKADAEALEEWLAGSGKYRYPRPDGTLLNYKRER